MELHNKTEEELRGIAKELGIKVHHLAKSDTIIKQIEKQQPHRVEAADEKFLHKAEMASKPEIIHTEEEVLKFIKPVTDRIGEDFKVTFPKDNTWIFECRGAVDSGHMSASPRLIKIKAEMVSRGARRLRKLDHDASDRSYAGAVLTT